MPNKTLPKPVIVGFFLIGVISATLIRSLIIVNRLTPEYYRTIWYTAVIGYIFFFGYRYYIARKRRIVIQQFELLQAIKKSDLSPQAKEQSTYLIQSLVRSREIYNYMIIFILSIVAIGLDIFLNYI